MNFNKIIRKIALIIFWLLNLIFLLTAGQLIMQIILSLLSEEPKMEWDALLIIAFFGLLTFLIHKANALIILKFPLKEDLESMKIYEEIKPVVQGLVKEGRTKEAKKILQSKLPKNYDKIIDKMF